MLKLVPVGFVVFNNNLSCCCFSLVLLTLFRFISGIFRFSHSCSLFTFFTFVNFVSSSSSFTLFIYMFFLSVFGIFGNRNKKDIAPIDALNDSRSIQWIPIWCMLYICAAIELEQMIRTILLRAPSILIYLSNSNVLLHGTL